MLFIDLVASHETLDSVRSKCNHMEAATTVGLLKLLNAAAKKGLKGLAGMIGVISPYKSQVRLLKNKIGDVTRRVGAELREIFEVNTVDAFQGREKQVIIFNCVRSNLQNSLQASLGFLIDERRLNVAITRPKHFLVVIGNAATLSKYPAWASMIDHCRETGCHLPIDTRREGELASEAYLRAQIDQLDEVMQSDKNEKLNAIGRNAEMAQDLLLLAKTPEERAEIEAMLQQARFNDLKR